MTKCAVLNCNNSTNRIDRNNQHISFHAFPSDPIVKEKWIDATGQKNWFPNKDISRICSIHFDKKCFKKTKKQQRLSLTAIPTIDILRAISNEEDLPQPSTSLNDTPVNTQKIRKLVDKLNRFQQKIKERDKKIKNLREQNHRKLLKIHTLLSLLESFKKKSFLNDEQANILNSTNVTTRELYRRQMRNAKKVTHNMILKPSQEMLNLSVAVVDCVSINIDSGTTSTAVTIMEEQLVEKEKDETNGTTSTAVTIKGKQFVEKEEEETNGTTSTAITIKEEETYGTTSTAITIKEEEEEEETYGTTSTAVTIMEEQLVVEEEEERNGTGENNIEEMQLEMPDENVEIGNNSNKIKPSGKKPYSCNICDKEFKYKSNLTAHMIVHTGVKPYSCNRCDKAYTQQSTLSRHMRVHTREKPYACNRCGKAHSWAPLIK